MRLLILGGTHHVGRAVVEVALARGDEVTTLTRGVSGPPAPGARALYADRRDPDGMRAVLGRAEWDAVVDTWSGAPVAVRDAVALLTGRVGHYGYVSSRSVYRWPLLVGLDESAPVVSGDPDLDTNQDYAAAKRGGEEAALQGFGSAALIARAGLVLGPYEHVGRLPWWLQRLARGGPTLAPGPIDRPLQYIDARDLASWLLAAADRGLGGIFNTVSRSGHTTMGGLLEECRSVTGARAELVWISPAQVQDAGIQPWTELPIWLPPEGEDAGLHDGDVSAAYAEGLRCRPVQQTVRDTWQWMQAEGLPQPPPGRPPVGLDPQREQELLARLGRTG